MAEILGQKSDTLWKSFLLFLLPLIATNILQLLSGTINTVFVGQMMGVNAVAAVSVFFPILFLMLALVIGLSAGATVLIGQAWGANKNDQVCKVAGTSIFLALFFGLLFASLGWIFCRQILTLLNTSADIQQLAEPYARTMFLGVPLLFIYIIYTSVLRGVGDSVTPFIVLLTTSGLGLLITPSLIDGYFGLPKLGIIGPAVASIIGYGAVLFILFFYLNYKKHPLRLSWTLIRHIRLNPATSWQILKLGIPVAVQMISAAIAGLVILSLVNQYGHEATAAYGAVNQIVNYVQFPAQSIGIAASIFAAQMIGRGWFDRVDLVRITALKVNIVLTGGLILMAYLLSHGLMSLFLTDRHVLILGEQLLWTMLWSLLFFGAATIYAAIMRASGSVLVPMLINVFAIFMVELPLAYLLSAKFGLQGIWYAYAAAFVSLFILQWMYFNFVWRKKEIHALI